MVETRVFTKSEYVNLIPPVSTGDYERLKMSIKKDGLHSPIMLNQNRVVLDGHHRLRACKEVGVPVTYNVRDFTGDPIGEVRYVVAVNLHRRHLDEFQRAEIGLKMDKIVRKLAAERKAKAQFTSETGREAGIKSGIERSVSPDTNRSGQAPTKNERDYQNEWENRSSKEIGDEVGVSAITVDRVRTILEDGTQEQIDGLRNKNVEGGNKDGPGVRTVYEEVQSNKLKTELEKEQQKKGSQRIHLADNLKLFNKDFRTVTIGDIPDDSVDLVLVLDFPEARRLEDEGGKIHDQVMECASNWLKDGGLLVMYTEQHFLPRVLCESRPLMLRFYRILNLLDSSGFYLHNGHGLFKQGWRPLVVFLKGVRDTEPLIPQVVGSDLIANSWADEKELATELVKRLSSLESTIVDPFMGERKAVIGQATLKTGRTYIGIEPETTRFLNSMDLLHET